MISPTPVYTSTGPEDFDLEQLVHLEQTCVPYFLLGDYRSGK